MRFGGGNSARLRHGLFAVGTVGLLAVVGVVVGLPVLRDRSQHRLERQADREVTATAQRARSTLLGDPAASASALRDAAAGVDGVEVLAVRDAVHRDGTRLVFRVRVAKTAASLFGWQRATAVGCFAQEVGPAGDPTGLERLPCPG